MVCDCTALAEQAAQGAAGDDRRVLNGIYWRLRTGSPWADIPEPYGPYTTCYNRFVRWGRQAVWERIFKAVSEAYDGSEQSLDATSIRVHPHGANAKRGVRRAPDPAAVADLRACALGRSRGGLTTKLHAVTDARGLPVTLHLTPGQAHDGKTGLALLGTLGPGQRLLADAAYDMNALRVGLAAAGSRPGSNPSAAATRYPPSTRPPLADATGSNASSARSNRSEQLPRATKSTTQTSSISSASQQPGYGCDIMSRWSRVVVSGRGVGMRRCGQAVLTMSCELALLSRRPFGLLPVSWTRR